MSKALYEKPTLRAHGKVESVTKGGADGAALDATFTVATPKGELTFS